MKNILSSCTILIIFVLSLVNCGGSMSGKTTDANTKNAPVAPDSTALPKSWQEHWFEHEQLVKRVDYNDTAAIYYDNDVNFSISWPLEYFSKVWKHVNDIYGDFGGDKRLFVIFHRDRYSGGHPATFFDASHDYRNVIDAGPGPWADSTGNNIDLTTHEIAHIVEGAAQGVKGSPAFGIWGDSKWAEIFNYDIYKSLGMQKEAKRWFALMNTTSDNFPRDNTYWFRDWFYPIWKNYGRSEVLGNYFELLAKHFPKENDEYSRDLNWGEFIHFWSGAAETNLKDRATEAFGWPDEWETQYVKAQQEFDEISY